MNIKQAYSLIDAEVEDLIDLCPHCDEKVHIEKLWNDYHSFRYGDTEFYVIFRCKACNKLILKTYFFKQNRFDRNQDLETKGWDEKFPRSLGNELSKQEKEYIPDHVISEYQEALKCRSIGAYRASCSMLRRALQSALVILGADHKLGLRTQIDSLDFLPDYIKNWAHQIRIFGNGGAHPDKDNLKEVDSDDVTEVHGFISKLFIYMFIMQRGSNCHIQQESRN